MNVADNLTYQCPHCSTVMEVQPELLGEHVSCVNCHKPFEVAVAKSVPWIKPQTKTAVHHPVVDIPADEEWELQTLHPALFRNHPFWYLLLCGILALSATSVVIFFARRADIDLSDWRIPDWKLLQGEPLLLLTAALIGFSALAYLIWRFKTYFVTLRITTERCVFQRGLIARSTSEVRHDDVRNLQVNQSLLERLLGVGTIAIASAGQDDYEILARGIPRPDNIVEILRNHQ